MDDIYFTLTQGALFGHADYQDAITYALHAANHTQDRPVFVYKAVPIGVVRPPAKLVYEPLDQQPDNPPAPAPKPLAFTFGQRVRVGKDVCHFDRSGETGFYVRTGLVSRENCVVCLPDGGLYVFSPDQVWPI